LQEDASRMHGENPASITNIETRSHVFTSVVMRLRPSVG
jgi:hypothetical protein